MKITVKEASAVFCLFSIPVLWGITNLLDEMIALISLAFILLYFLKNNRISKENLRYIILWGLLLFCGLLGNFLFGIQQSGIAIFLDVFATFKGFLIYYAFKVYYKNAEINKRIFKRTALLFECFIVICVLFSIVNLFVDFGMRSVTVANIPSFRFFYTGAANYSLCFYCIAFVVLLNLAMTKNSSKAREYIVIILTMFAWGVSLRSRVFAYILLFLLMYFLIMKNFIKKVKVWHLVILGISILPVLFDKFVYYFFTETTARFNLFRYSIETMITYFPIGSGFATYGSDMAGVYYSPLYVKYGFNSVWGLSEANPSFANDSFWPEILGQFGVVGFLIFIYFLFCFYRKFFALKVPKFEKMVLQWFLIVMFIGSSGTKTYMHPVIIPVYIVFALYENIAMQNIEKQSLPFDMKKL